MAQAVSRRPLTAEARVGARVSPCGTCGGQSGNGTGFFRDIRLCPVNIISLSLSNSYHLRVNNMSVSGSSSET
jgi:hypothetical protein